MAGQLLFGRGHGDVVTEDKHWQVETSDLTPDAYRGHTS
jgi:hypothetical protein